MLAFVIVCVFIAQFVHGACSSWDSTHSQGLAVGTYGPCLYLTNGANVIATFDDAGALSVHYGVTHPGHFNSATHTVLWTTSIANASTSNLPATINLDSVGVLTIFNADNTIRWSSQAQNTLYPGRPDSSNLWNVAIDGFGVSVLYMRTAVWQSTGGIVYAHSMPIGTSLGINQYIQAEDSFLLSQLDGKICKYQGIYPASTGTPACVTPES